MLTFWRGWVDGMPGPISARAGGAATPRLPRQGTPRPPKQPSLCCLRGPAQQFHFPGGRRETRKKERTLRPGGVGAQGGGRLSSECPAARLARGSGLPAAPPSGGLASDFNGSSPSQQHFGLRRDTERRETGRGQRRAKEEGEGGAERTD